MRWMRYGAVAASIIGATCLGAGINAEFGKNGRSEDSARLGAVRGVEEWPAHLKYFPEDHVEENRIRRRERVEVAEIIHNGVKPVKVRKMGEDGSEMFWPEYWGFDINGAGAGAGQGSNELGVRADYEEDHRGENANSSAVLTFRPPFAIHEASNTPNNGWRKAARALAMLQKRDFSCPTGTSPCTAISQPNYCCSSGETCSLIPDTGLGPVGCCPAGVSCAGDITVCNTAAGQSPCPQELGGACCVAGFGCVEVGCVRVDTATAVWTLNPGAPSSPPSVTTTTSTAPVVVTPTSLSSTTPIVVIPPVTVPPEATRQTSLPCNGLASFTACPPDIGGCCFSGRLCQAGNLCPLPGETITPLPPVRGTGTTAAAGPSTSTPAIIGDACPTGFYACSAFYPGGPCCRIGRDCVSTYCATTASGTIISDGRTVVVPLVPAATTTAVGSCAQGWTGCPAQVGGLCCPDGWACGTASCSSVAATETRVAGKAQPVVNGGERVYRSWGLAGVVAVLAVVAVGL